MDVEQGDWATKPQLQECYDKDMTKLADDWVKLGVAQEE
jgi:hypothetical protein